MLILPGGQGHDIRTADMPTDDELKPRTSAAAGSTRVAGIVLCGGRSSRMGQPKHLLPFGDETMLQRVVRTLSAVVSPVVVVAARGQQLPELPPETLIAHDDLENPGPLGGIAAGMQAIGEQADAAYCTSCDVPLLQPEFVRQIIGQLDDADLVMPQEGRFHHPLAAVYRLKLEAEIRSLLAAGQMRPVFLLDRCQSRIIAVEDLRQSDPELDSLRNTNTPEEYADTLQRAGYAAPESAP